MKASIICVNKNHSHLSLFPNRMQTIYSQIIKEATLPAGNGQLIKWALGKVNCCHNRYAIVGK